MIALMAIMIVLFMLVTTAATILHESFKIKLYNFISIT